jgi:hypothetical protein
MFGPIRAVAIDDEPSHLLAITAALSASGIPCMGYWYDRETNGIKPEPPQGGLPYVRLIFMDLNLAELAGLPDAKSLSGPVISVLKDIVAPNGGPYVLIFWTQVGSRVGEVGQILYERLETVAGVPCPISVVELDKSQFLTADPAQGDFKTALTAFYSDLHAMIPGLKQAVEGVVSRNPQLNALGAWETRASDAAALAVNEVFACAKEDTPDPAGRSESIGKVLAKIAAAAASEYVNEEPARALDAGMVDILVDQFGASVGKPGYNEAIKAAIGEAVKNKASCRDEVRVSAALNTFFHIDTEVGSAKAGDRGVVISAMPFNKGELGFRHNDLLNEFLSPIESFEKLPRYPKAKALWDEFKRSPEFVLVELGADCDHAQDTTRTRRYLVGLEIPVKYFELIHHPEFQNLRSEALQLLGPWTIGQKTFFLLVSCRRFWVWQERKPHAKGVVKYRLRTSLVNKLLHHYATWHSRPGIVEFRTDVKAPAFLYFAYGSNMLVKRLLARAPSAAATAIGYIEGARIAFDKVSVDGSGKCTFQDSADSKNLVHGVLFRIDTDDKTALDMAEGLGDGYEERTVQVIVGADTIEAVTYVAMKTDQALKPYDWYHESVVKGATDYGLPDAYVDSLRTLGSQPDPDEQRATENRMFLKEEPIESGSPEAGQNA